jgi:hypothetical protein
MLKQVVYVHVDISVAQEVNTSNYDKRAAFSRYPP